MRRLKRTVQKVRTSGLLHRLLANLGLEPPESRIFAVDEEMSDYLRAVSQNEQRPVDDLLTELLASGVEQHNLAQEAWQLWESLSPREKQVAALTCLDYTNKAIGYRLSISPDTAKVHVRNVLYKFNLHSKQELRAYLAEWDFSAWERNR